MNDRLVFFSTDKGFLVPTLTAALQVASQDAVTSVADIIVFLVNFAPLQSSQIRNAFAGTKLIFLDLDLSTLLPSSSNFFHQTHVPITTMARLFTFHGIPSQYEHIVYLDGDIQVVGDLSPLVSFDVRPGMILAANDQVFLCEARFGAAGRFWKTLRHYLADLQLDDPKAYFNAGVLACRRTTWATISQDAMSYFTQHSQKCIFHDQSALNAVCKGKRLVLNPIYNMISNFMVLKTNDCLKPSLIHFTGANKPWHDNVPEWQEPFRGPYERLLERFPLLHAYRPSRDNKTERDRKAATTWRGVLIQTWYDRLKGERLRRYLRNTKFELTPRA